jgi:topoisomerase-4 subunit B
MGDKVEPRRKWIESHVQFSLEEDGSILDKKEDTVPELVDEKLMDTEQAESKHLVKE